MWQPPRPSSSTNHHRESSGPVSWSFSWLLQGTLLAWEMFGGSLICVIKMEEVSDDVIFPLSVEKWMCITYLLELVNYSWGFLFRNFCVLSVYYYETNILVWCKFCSYESEQLTSPEDFIYMWILRLCYAIIDTFKYVFNTFNYKIL